MLTAVMDDDTRSVRVDHGFTLVELMVVLMILSILITIGMASYAKLATIADNRGTQLDLITAVKVQALIHLETDAFSSDLSALRDLEPNIRYSSDGEPPGTVVVRIEVSETDVCLFSQNPSGDWFAIHHSVSSGDRYSESAPLACTSGNVASWSSEPW